MSFKLKDANDIKIFILYLLKNVGRPLNFNDLNDVVVKDGLVGHIDFAENLAQLIDTGNIHLGQKGEYAQLSITEQGRQVAETLQSQISGYIRTKSLESAMRYLDFKERGITTSVTTTERDDRKYDLHVEVKEKDVCLLSLTLTIDNLYLAEKMEYNFDSHPEMVYKSILSLMAGDANYMLS